MPEGHVIHRLAHKLDDAFATEASSGRPLTVSSPQGRFAAGAKLVGDLPYSGSDAHGKHLFVKFGGDRWIHVHLGLYGSFRVAKTAAGPVEGQVRLRLEGENGHADLRGASACDVYGPEERAAMLRKLGPDPLRSDADPELAWRKVSKSSLSIAELLMEQSVLSGVGNVYRAEVLFRAGLDPYLVGRDLTREQWDGIWADLVDLMAVGTAVGRIDTVHPEHTPEVMGRPPRKDDHGGEVYAYRRNGQPCLVCGTPIATAGVRDRNLFWCPGCQPSASARGTVTPRSAGSGS
jgi:endonuclease-8